ncbi:MAG: IPT/TIG domain-containing protein, partial [Dehalococcoidia bacterium]
MVFDHRVIAGIQAITENCNTWGSSEPAYRLYCWHDDYHISPPAGSGSAWALDLNIGAGSPDPNIDQPVSFQDWGIAGEMHAKILNLVGTNCTGVDILLTDKVSGIKLGDLYYLHLVVPTALYGTEFDVLSGQWNIQPLGTIAATQPGCDYRGAHVHQGGENGSGTAISANKCAFNPPDIVAPKQCGDASGFANYNVPINPVGDFDNHWVNRIAWTPTSTSVLPSVTGVSPMSGPSSGQTAVTVTGNNLGSVQTGNSTDTEIDFGAFKATNVLCVNNAGASSCTSNSPPGIGIVHITVLVSGVRSVSVPVDQFTYTGSGGGSGGPPVVSAVSPPFGPSGGGTQVTIVGQNLLGGMVSFGGVAATNISCGSECTATSPQGSGAVDVTVIVAGVASTVASGGSDRFTYNGFTPPVINTV